MNQLYVTPTVIGLLGIDGSKLLCGGKGLGQRLAESGGITLLGSLGRIKVKVCRIPEITLCIGQDGCFFCLDHCAE